MSKDAKDAPKQKKMRTIGRWYIGETLGKGGYSWVKKGFDKKTGKCVALKFMAKADESWASEQSKQVVTEIESLKQIRHPNVMKLYAYNLNARYPTKKNDKIDTVLLVLEFAPGGEIFDILYYTSALESILARTYFRQSIFGLEACHNAGVAHRDIKPQNLLLDSRFNIKLTDFGLSKVFESDADAIMKTTYVGTRGYQAPELLLDKPYDLACDIFSMGVVLFILITGYPPFEQAHYSDRWFRPIHKGNYEKFWKYHAGCSISNDAKCKDLLEKMLCFDPSKRITISNIKKHPWFTQKYLEGKELIRALRHRHREMEAKRRRDARKIKDLQVSITPNRAVKGPIVPDWDANLPEEVLSNSFIHCDDPKEFFEYLSGLIGNVYSGETVYDHENATMICTIRKMERAKDKIIFKENENGKMVKVGMEEAKAVSKDYKFEIALFKSLQYASKSADDKKTDDDVEAEEENDDVEKVNKVDDEAEAQDDKDHSNATNKATIYVVRCRRILGDDLQFRKLQKKVYLDGQQIFNGLPGWAVKMETTSAFDELLKNWDNPKNGATAKYVIKEGEYDNVKWDDDVQVACN